MLFLLCARRARAEEQPLTLEWTAPADCPKRAVVLARVSTLLGQNRSGTPRPPAQVSGVVTRTAAGALLHLQTRVSRAAPEGALAGERRIEGATCEEVTAAGALVIALAIDPDAVASGATPAPAGEDSPAPSPPEPAGAEIPPGNPPANAAEPPRGFGPDTAPADPPPAPAARGGSRFFAAAHALLDAGSLPGPAFGARPAFGIATERLRAEAGVSYFFARFAEASAADTSGANVSLLVGNLRGCYRLPPEVVSLEGCLGAEAGAFMAEGQNFERNTTAAAPWLAAEIAAGASVQLAPRLSFLMSAGVLVPFGRSAIRFAANESGPGTFTQIHRPGLASLRLGAGLSLSFR